MEVGKGLVQTVEISNGDLPLLFYVLHLGSQVVVVAVQDLLRALIGFQ